MKTNKKIIIGSIVALSFAVGVTWIQRIKSVTTYSAELPSAIPHQAQRLPDAGEPQFANPPDAASNTRQKFADMDVLERNAIRREIGKQDLPTIFQAMLDAERIEHDPMKQMGLQTTLAGALKQKKPSQDFLEQMREFITNSSNSSFERELLIGALESASTKETVDLLIKIAATAQEEKIRDSAGALAGVGDSGKGGLELSSALEQVWRESSNPNQLISAASAMAKIGAPSGIEILLSSALATDQKDEFRLKAARDALSRVYLPDAVPPLAARLSNQPISSASAELVAPILVKIGNAAASKAVVNWLQNSSENAALMIHDLIRQRTVNETMFSSWEAALDPTIEFRNEQNREAIRSGLAAYHANHVEK